MTTTDNLGLSLPESNDYADVAVLGQNFQKLDTQALKAQAAKAAPADADKVPVVDSADGSKTKLVLWSAIKNLFAAANHSHAWGTITGRPSSFAPTAHKSSHAIGGTDVLTAADVGAAAASHTHGNVTSAGQIGGVTLDSTLVRLVSGALQTLEGTATGMQIATGSYTGTGTYGSGNKNSLTFPFVPKLIYITASTMTNGYGDTITLSNWKLWHNGLVNAFVGYSGDNAQDTYSVNNKTFSWYNNRNATEQLNYSGQQYYYTAIG